MTLDSSLPKLFVPQGLNGIQTRGTDGGYHTADQPYGTEDKRGHDQSARSNHQADVAGFGVLRYGAVEGEPSDRKRNSVRQNDSQRAADESNGEGFGQELKKDMPPPRAQRLFHSNLTGSLGYRDQHDVHEADPADAQRKRTDEAQQNREAERNEFELVNLFHEVKHHHGAAISRVELVLDGHHSAHRALQALVSSGLVVEPDGVEVLRILEVADGGEGDVD